MFYKKRSGRDPAAVGGVKLSLAAILAVLSGMQCSDDQVGGPETGPAVAGLSSSTPPPVKNRIIIIAIDSLNPEYLEMDALASGAQGGPGNWLMPRVRQFVKGAAQWTDARAPFPQATDMNHLNVLAGTHSGLTGVIGVSQQPYWWKVDQIHLGQIHLAKARYPDGSQVKTIFDLLESATSGSARTAFVGNKNWVPAQYGAGFGKPATVDLFVNGQHHPSYIPAPSYVSFHDNPATDQDHMCDPESIFQTLVLNWRAKQNPAEHPRDFWVADATLKVMDHENPDMIYVLLGDLDHGQHSLGAVNNPAEWVEGPLPQLPSGCEQKPHYRLVSERNQRLYKEPILDLIRDVDDNFGKLMDGLAAGGYLANTRVVLVSDHNMINYLYRDNIEPLTDVTEKLDKVGLAPVESFFNYGAGSVGMLFWRPAYKQQNPNTVEKAKLELLHYKHKAYNHETGNTELPWAIMDRQDMINGRPDLGIGPGELYNSFFVKKGMWPDLAVVMLNGWQIPSGTFFLGSGPEFTLFNAGHGAPDTAAVVVATKGFGVPAGATCPKPVRLADIGATVASTLGFTFPYSVGQPLTCNGGSSNP